MRYELSPRRTAGITNVCGHHTCSFPRGANGPHPALGKTERTLNCPQPPGEWGVNVNCSFGCQRAPFPYPTVLLHVKFQVPVGNILPVKLIRPINPTSPKKKPTAQRKACDDTLKIFNKTASSIWL